MTQADGQTADGQPVATEADDAQTVEAALAEFDAQTSEPKSEPKSEDMSAFLQEWRADREDRLKEKMQTDISEAVTKVKGDLSIPDGIVDDVLWGRASKDPKFLNAFQSRHENPDAWERVLGAFHSDLKKQFQPVDSNVTEDLESAQAAARSASTQPEEKPLDAKELANMSDAEFERLKSTL